MLTINVRSNVDDVLRQLDARRDQMPYAVARALTKTAGLVKDAERKEMLDVFDRPTPWTLNSLFTKPATKQELTAYVSLKGERNVSTGTPADKYLTPEIRGGARSLKRFELAFRSAGILPSNMMMVPGDAMPLDPYGNIARGQIVQLLSYFRAFPEQGYSANITPERKAKLKRGTKTRQGFEYFALREPHGKLPPGIYKRVHFAHGSAVKPMIIFVDSAHYEAVFEFGYVAQITVERNFAEQLRLATAEALATAR